MVCDFPYLFVAAITITCARDFRPSMSVSSCDTMRRSTSPCQQHSTHGTAQHSCTQQQQQQGRVTASPLCPTKIRDGKATMSAGSICDVLLAPVMTEKQSAQIQGGDGGNKLLLVHNLTGAFTFSDGNGERKPRFDVTSCLLCVCAFCSQHTTQVNRPHTKLPVQHCCCTFEGPPI